MLKLSAEEAAEFMIYVTCRRAPLCSPATCNNYPSPRPDRAVARPVDLPTCPRLSDGFRIRCPGLNGLVEHAARSSLSPGKRTPLPNMQGVLRHAYDHIMFAHVLFAMHTHIAIS